MTLAIVVLVVAGIAVFILLGWALARMAALGDRDDR